LSVERTLPENRFMRDIWNPWHGCRRVSEGCQHCYMFFLDEQRGRDCSEIHRNDQAFRYPIQKDRQGHHKVPSGSQLRVCMSSDFFLAEADGWREEAWEMMRQRPDVRFFLLTKRPERVANCLPVHWGQGWSNVMLNVSCENQARADERIPQLLALPFRHKGLMAAPLLGELRLGPYLASGQLEQVIAGGENYGGTRPCDFDWIRTLRASCDAHRVTFCFIETGSTFVKDGRTYRMSRRVQSEMAHKSGISFQGLQSRYHLTDRLGRALSAQELHRPTFRSRRDCCGSRPICNGCSNCGKCSP
jgi:protein gp37